MRESGEPDRAPKQTEERRSADSEADVSPDADSMSLDEIAEAEASRPDLPDETDDGLNDLEESVRRQAEDLPAGAAWRR